VPWPARRATGLRMGLAGAKQNEKSICRRQSLRRPRSPPVPASSRSENRNQSVVRRMFRYQYQLGSDAMAEIPSALQPSIDADLAGKFDGSPRSRCGNLQFSLHPLRQNRVICARPHLALASSSAARAVHDSAAIPGIRGPERPGWQGGGVRKGRPPQTRPPIALARRKFRNPPGV
jgi:hypothetical protein